MIAAAGPLVAALGVTDLAFVATPDAVLVAPLDLIEVQTGRYLGEDDIERFEDRYARAPAREAAKP